MHGPQNTPHSLTLANLLRCDIVDAPLPPPIASPDISPLPLPVLASRFFATAASAESDSLCLRLARPAASPAAKPPSRGSVGRASVSAFLNTAPPVEPCRTSRCVLDGEGFQLSRCSRPQGEAAEGRKRFLVTGREEEGTARIDEGPVGEEEGSKSGRMRNSCGEGEGGRAPWKEPSSMPLLLPPPLLLLLRSMSGDVPGPMLPLPFLLLSTRRMMPQPVEPEAPLPPRPLPPLLSPDCWGVGRTRPADSRPAAEDSAIIGSWCERLGESVVESVDWEKVWLCWGDEDSAIIGFWRQRGKGHGGKRCGNEGSECRKACCGERQKS